VIAGASVSTLFVNIPNSMASTYKSNSRQNRVTI
jgi:hypothetical protein